MKALLCLILLVIATLGCEDMRKPAMGVITAVPTIAEPEPADVLIYTRITWWTTPTEANIEAKITQQVLESQGIKTEITESELYVGEWLVQTKANGSVNVLILYGVLPDTIYPGENVLPDTSLAER